MNTLQIRNLRKSFGGLHVLKDVNLSVEHGERRAVIGPNGAGKTTLFNIIGGMLRPDGGQILFSGKDISRLQPYERARLGIGRTFQKNNLFFQLSLSDNLKLALQRVKSPQSPEEYLEKLGMEDRKDILVNELSYGEQRQMELLLALAQSPGMILLDEPTAGMSPAETEKIIKMIAALPRNITILMIEHDMEVVFHFADRIAVLHQGQVICDGDGDHVRSDPGVREAYLGREEQKAAGKEEKNADSQ